jgi:hypothetical protein
LAKNQVYSEWELNPKTVLQRTVPDLLDRCLIVPLMSCSKVNQIKSIIFDLKNPEKDSAIA